MVLGYRSIGMKNEYLGMSVGKLISCFLIISWLRILSVWPSTVADPGFLKGGCARSAPQNLAPPTFYIIINGARARPSHEQNRTRTSELAKFRGGI